MSPNKGDSICWQPSQEFREKSLLTAFTKQIGKSFASYQDLHLWSINQRAEFWSSFWDFAGIKASKRGQEVIRHPERMPGSEWFPESSLNYAENLLARLDEKSNHTALYFWCEDKIKIEVSQRQLHQQVAACAASLRAAGIKKNDRVAGLLPNCPEAIIAYLATASIGAVWCSASPDFGVQGVLDRFGQIEPKLLFVVDGYWYNGKQIDCRAKNSEIRKNLSTVGSMVVVELLGLSHQEQSFKNFLENDSQPLKFEQVPFAHPLVIMFSSGTTGVPKCIVHSHGGTLLQHLKEHQLQSDLRPGDKLFYFTTLGWMMWNWLVSGLGSGASLLLYDGSPFVKNGDILFDFLDATGCTHFGVSAKFLDAAAKKAMIPKNSHSLKSMRVLFSTGSPLGPDGFDFVYSNIKSDVLLASISGGTDIISCFVLGNPWSPVHRGEIQGPGLGMDIQVWDEEGKTTTEKGELICAQSFPSMPLGFWNDKDQQKYKAAYFARFPGVWCHGDFVQKSAAGGFVIYGRSDAVLNPGGVRIGTAEIYRQVESLSEITESIVIGQAWENDVRVVLFVKLSPGHTLSKDLQDKIKEQIRRNTTPRHVPAKILEVADIPRTKSGKIVELAVRNIVHGEAVKNIEALANPEALEHFRNRSELA